MKIFRIFLVFLVTGALIIACSKESKEEMSSLVNESAPLAITSTDLPLDANLQKLEAALLNFDQTEEFKAQSMVSTSRNALPARVLNTVARNYPNATIQSYEVYPSTGSYQHYSVLLDNGIEFVVFQYGHVLARATIETVYESNELKAGQLPWDVLLRTYSNYSNDLIEEVEPRTNGTFEIDLKDGRELIINARGRVIAINQDADGDDDDGATGGNSLPGLDGINNSSSGDDDDDGLGDNDDGVSGNNDDDDDGNGDNDDGLSNNNDDDDDGDGDNDDGFSNNNDDDDDGDYDNDDGINGNSDDDDDGNGDDDDGIAGNDNDDDDDNGNGDNDDGIAGNDNDDDDDNGTSSDSSDNDDDDDNGTSSGSSDNDDDDDNGTSSGSSDNDDDDDNGTSSGGADNDDDDDNGTSDNDDDDN